MWICSQLFRILPGGGGNSNRTKRRKSGNLIFMFQTLVAGKIFHLHDLITLISENTETQNKGIRFYILFNHDLLRLKKIIRFIADI